MTLWLLPTCCYMNAMALVSKGFNRLTETPIVQSESSLSVPCLLRAVLCICGVGLCVCLHYKHWFGIFFGGGRVGHLPFKSNILMICLPEPSISSKGGGEPFSAEEKDFPSRKDGPHRGKISVLIFRAYQ